MWMDELGYVYAKLYVYVDGWMDVESFGKVGAEELSNICMCLQPYACRGYLYNLWHIKYLQHIFGYLAVSKSHVQSSKYLCRALGPCIYFTLTLYIPNKIHQMVLLIVVHITLRFY